MGILIFQNKTVTFKIILFQVDTIQIKRNLKLPYYNDTKK